MPVVVHSETKRLSQDDFSRLAYDVMGHIFHIHAKFGRFLREEIYHRELARRCGGFAEVPIEVSYGRFRKFYYIDLLVGLGAVFELKAVHGLTDRHRGQLLQYLLLANLSHGKLINLDSELVEHEFVNTTLTSADRRHFTIDVLKWDPSCPGANDFKVAVTEVLLDLGTALHCGLYDRVLTHVLGGRLSVVRNAEILSDGRVIGSQHIRLAAPSVAFKFTTVRESEQQRVHDHLRRFLNHSNLTAIQWINVRHPAVTFTTIRRST